MYFPSVPFSYAVELTPNCNNSCPGCANVLRTHPNETLHKWRTLFDAIAPPENRHKHAELIRLTGGEPTLHPEFREIVEYVDTFGISHATFTNGRWQDPDEVINVFRNCHNCVGLLVSLHGSTTSAHIAFTGGNGIEFDETCQNIQRATEAGIEVFTDTVFTKYNCENIAEIIALSQQLGASYAVFNRFLGPPHPIEPAMEYISWVWVRVILQALRQTCGQYPAR